MVVDSLRIAAPVDFGGFIQCHRLLLSNILKLYHIHGRMLRHISYSFHFIEDTEAVWDFSSQYYVVYRKLDYITKSLQT